MSIGVSYDGFFFAALKIVGKSLVGKKRKRESYEGIKVWQRENGKNFFFCFGGRLLFVYVHVCTRMRSAKLIIQGRRKINTISPVKFPIKNKLQCQKRNMTVSDREYFFGGRLSTYLTFVLMCLTSIQHPYYIFSS